MGVIGSLLTLERTLPDGVLAGVLTGQYSVHGGVIRDVSGRIVRHLVSTSSSSLNPFGMVGDIFGVYNTYQLRHLTEMTQQLLQIGAATMAMSGLNLAISAIGFKLIHGSLKKVDEHLKTLDKKLNWIATFLDSGRRARLLNAIEELSALPSDGVNRDHILRTSRSTLGEVAMHYRQHWDESTELSEAMAYQHYFCMAFIAKARCSAELDMHKNARQEFEDGIAYWRDRTRKIVVEQIFGENRSRFVGKNYLELAPLAKIAEWMDFAYGEQKGYEWLDVLRAEYQPPSFLRGVFTKENAESLKRETTYLDNLVARNHVLEGYKSQLLFLEDQSIRPSILEAELNALIQRQQGDPVLILAPAA